MRRLILIVLLLLGFFFVLNQFAELQQVVDAFRRADPRWLVLGIAVHLLWLLNLGASFDAIYRLLGMRENILHLALVATAAQFIGVVAPSGGVSGMAVLLADGNRRGHPAGRVTTAAVLFTFFETVSLLAVISLGMVVLFRRGLLNSAEVAALLILVGIALVVGLLLVLGLNSAHLLGRALAWLGMTANRVGRPIFRRQVFDPDQAHIFAFDVHDALHEVRQAPRNLLLPAALSMSSKALLMTILFLVFLAFHQPYTPGMLVASFSVGYLFYIVSPTPTGFGLVEGFMTLALGSLRVPVATAAAIVLAFRGVTTWLTILYGMVVIRWVGLRPPSRHEPGS
jgi:uncharacterized protein (TIRG00374 family)